VPKFFKQADSVSYFRLRLPNSRGGCPFFDGPITQEHEID
jgi:hypothetical protein